MRRSLTVIAVGAVVTVACAPAGSDNGATRSPSSEQAVSQPDVAVPSSAGAREPIRTESIGCEDGEFHWDQEDCQPATSVDLDAILSGGPPPDGIPPIDEPVYEPIEDAAQWLEDTSPVMVIDIDADVRAYPLAILTWHEIVNDVVGGVPVVVTYCPLCNSALVFDRTIEGPDGEELLDFGTSGRLFNSNLVMFDRQHRNLWTQFEGEAIVGDRFLGDRLRRIPAWLFGFDELAELHPDAQVLSRETGRSRDYGLNPYTGYDRAERDPFLFDGELDERFPPMTRLVGLGDREPVAILLDQLVEERTVHTEVDGRGAVVVWAPGQASALDTASIDAGREVGQTAAFIAEADGRPVELAASETDGRFVDEVSGSSFDLRGRALDGPLEGQRLEPIVHDDTFWFVWLAFRPDTAVVRG